MVAGEGEAGELLDSHCHLDLRQFDDDREAVIQRARAAGVRAIINPSIDLSSSGRVLALAERVPEIYAAVGVHPNDCAGFGPDAIAELTILARRPRVVAIGEIGLDRYWQKVDESRQLEALRAQLALAADLNLPVILHSRDANGAPGECGDALLCEIEQWWPEIRKRRGADAIFGVWHAFSGTLEQAGRAYELGLILGLGGPVTFTNARQLHALVPHLDPARLIMETDAPYLAPHPHRGKRNEPAYVALVTQRLADLWGMTSQQVASMAWTTATRCFGLQG